METYRSRCSKDRTSINESQFASGIRLSFGCKIEAKKERCFFSKRSSMTQRKRSSADDMKNLTGALSELLRQKDASDSSTGLGS